MERAIADRKLVLPAGWHSAMAQVSHPPRFPSNSSPLQGHGLSLLSRAYLHTKDVGYLSACQAALPLFEKEAPVGGIVNHLFGHPWYEEYPTTPGSYVLNGFMYSLIGLHDFRTGKIFLSLLKINIFS